MHNAYPMLIKMHIYISRGGDIKHFLGYGKNGSDYYAWSNQQVNIHY